MSGPWPLRVAATAAPALLALLALLAARDAPLRIAPGTTAWSLLVRGPAPDGTLRDGASVLLPGLARERTTPLFIEARALATQAAVSVGADGGVLEPARVESGGVASRVPPAATRGARLELRAPGGPVRLGGLEIPVPSAPMARLLPALLLPPAVVLLLRRRAPARLAMALALATSALLLLASAPILDLLIPVRAAAWLGPAAAAVAVAVALRPQRRDFWHGLLVAAALVFGVWIRLVFLPSAGSWDMEYWKAWTSRADAHGVARVYGDADAVPAGHFLAQWRGAEPLWRTTYRGRVFVVDYPPLAMGLWRWSWRAVSAVAPRLDQGEAENVAAKLPAVLGDVAAVVLLLVLFRTTPWRAVALAAAYWALPVSWLSSAVLGFLDGALAVLVVAALVAAGRGRGLAAGILLGLAALIKPTALVVAPAVWCALAARPRTAHGPSPIARALAGGTATALASLVPFAVAGTVQTALVHVYRILFQGTLSGGFPNVWWLLGHALTVAREGAPLAGPVRFTPLDLLPLPARPMGTLLFLASAVVIGRAQRGRPGVARACLAGALLVLSYGVCAVGVHENHPHALFLALLATGLVARPLRLFAAGCAFVYVVNMLMLSGLGRFYGPRHAIAEPLARALAGARMAFGFDFTLLLAVLQVGLFAWALLEARSWLEAAVDPSARGASAGPVE
jgi:hypothetical protein